ASHNDDGCDRGDGDQQSDGPDEQGAGEASDAEAAEERQDRASAARDARGGTEPDEADAVLACLRQRACSLVVRETGARAPSRARQAQSSLHGPSTAGPASCVAAWRSWWVRAVSSAIWRSASASLVVTRSWNR